MVPVTNPSLNEASQSAAGVLMEVRDTPAEIAKCLRYLAKQRTTLSRWRVFGTVLWLLYTTAFALLTYSLGRDDGIPLPFIWGFVWASWGLYIVLYALIKLISPSRAVNASGKRSFGSLPLALILTVAPNYLLLMFYEDYDLGALVSGLVPQFGFLANPKAGCELLIIGMASLIVPTGAFMLRRMKRITPVRDELTFCSEIVGWILADLPPGSRCRAILRPYPSDWTEITRGPASSTAKATYLDEILAFDGEIEPGVRIRVSCVHARRSKGRRKHKGWKHKVKTRVQLISSDDGRIKTNARPQIMRLVDTSLRSGKVRETLPGSWTRIDTNGVAFEGRSGKASLSVVTGKVRMRRTFTGADLPHPHQILLITRALVEGALTAQTAQPKQLREW